MEAVVEAARRRKPFSVTALAVHGLMVGVLDLEQRYRLNCFDLAVPDGELASRGGLRDRVGGPDPTSAVCARAEREGLSVYFDGSAPEVLSRIGETLPRQFPRLVIAGAKSSTFQHLTPAEQEEVAVSISESSASIVFVGLACSRQEVWAYEFRNALPIPLLAPGAAFSFTAVTVPSAPKRMQERGLEWLFRLKKEPLRLWKRYLVLNFLYWSLLTVQAMGIHDFLGRGSYKGVAVRTTPVVTGSASGKVLRRTLSNRESTLLSPLRPPPRR